MTHSKQVLTAYGTCNPRATTIDDRTCSFCQRVFDRKAKLAKHLEARDKRGGTCEEVTSGPVMKNSLTCAVCSAVHISYGAYITHATTAHGFMGTIDKKSFESELQMSEWIADTMKTGKFRWSKAAGGHKDGKSTYYQCHRSGTYTDQGQEIRNRRAKNTSKLDAHCPCFLQVRKEAGGMNATFCISHLGHDTSSAYLPVNPRVQVDYLHHLPCSFSPSCWSCTRRT